MDTEAVGEFHIKSMDIKEEGCNAFADALEKYGIEAYMESRAD